MSYDGVSLKHVVYFGRWVTLRLIISSSSLEADHIAFTYNGFLFLVDRMGLSFPTEGKPRRSGVHFSNISVVIRGPFAR